MLLITASMLLALFSCAKQKPASVVESTTEPAAESTLDKTKPDRALFDDIVIGKTTRAEYFAIVGDYDYESFFFGRDIDRFEWSDAGYVYVEFMYAFEENGEIKDLSVVRNISKDYTEPTYDRALLEQVSVEMSARDFFALFDGDTGNDIGSGRWILQYLCTDGSIATVVLARPKATSGESYPVNYFEVESFKITEPTNE